MTPKQFRLFLFLSFLSAIVATVFELKFQMTIPPQLNEAIERLHGQPSDARMLFGLALALGSVVLSFVSAIGMFGFKPWAPKLALTSTFMAGLASSLVGSGLISSVASTLTFASATLWGSVLAIAHTPLYASFARASAPRLPTEV